MGAPLELKDFEDSQISSISAGCDKSALVNSYGELFTWGSSKNNSLLDANGDSYKDNLRSPTLFALEDVPFVQVASGKEHIAAITKDGRLYTMGTINHG